VLGLKRKLYVSFIALIGMMLITITTINHFIMPEISHNKSARELSKKLQGILPPDVPLMFYKDIRESIMFYTNRTCRLIEDQEDLESYLNSNSTVYCIINVKYYNKLINQLHAAMYPVAQEGSFMIIANNKHAMQHGGIEFDPS
jgi:hypothetical protein